MKRKLQSIVLLILIISPGYFAQAVFETGAIAVGVNQFGRIRLYTPNAGGLQEIYRTSILVGVDQNQVFDYFNDAWFEDTTKLVRDSVSLAEDSSRLEIYGSFNNSDSNLPPNVLVKLNVYGWRYSSYVLLKFTIINRELNPINAIAGLDILSQIQGTTFFDTVKYNSQESVVDIFQDRHVGYKLLSDSLTSLTSFNYFDGYEKDSSYFSWLTHGTIDSFFAANDSGSIVITAQAPKFLNPSDSITIYYALAFGYTEADMLVNIDSAALKYNNITSVEAGEFIIAKDFILYQNYPNPFNPTTKIKYIIPETGSLLLRGARGGSVTLKIYDILGDEIATLVNEEQSPGEYEVEFDGRNLAGGVYFYSLRVEGFSETKKMLIIK